MDTNEKEQALKKAKRLEEKDKELETTEDLEEDDKKFKKEKRALDEEIKKTVFNE